MATFTSFHHPSLLLGQVVDRELLRQQMQAQALQAATEAAGGRLNALVAMRRSLDMTMNELRGFDVDFSALKERLASLDAEIGSAAAGYLSARIDNDSAVQKIVEAVAKIPASNVESPVNLALSSIIRPPLAADALKIDVQYFSHEEGDETGVLKLQDAVRASSKPLGPRADELAQAAGSQVRAQRTAHTLVGTLMIAASCVHRHTASFEPLVLEADRLVAAWNAGCADADRLDDTDPDAMKARAAPRSRRSKTRTNGSAEGTLALITGVTYASSFVGMVHVSGSRGRTDGMPSAAEIQALRQQVELGGWLSDQTGDLGTEGPLSEPIQRLLGKRALDSHANLLVLGAISPLSMSRIGTGIDKVLDRRLNAELSNHLSYGDGDEGGSRPSSRHARLDRQRVATQSTMARNVLESLGRMESSADPAIDARTMLAAFDNYLEAATAEEAVGVPVAFSLRHFTAAQVARVWLDQRVLAEKGPAPSPNAPDADA